MNIYVTNIAYGVTEADLRAAFASFGGVQSARIIYDQATGRSRGFGFVEMAIRSEAEAAIATLGKAEIQGRKMRLSEAEGRSRNPVQNYEEIPATENPDE